MFHTNTCIHTYKRKFRAVAINTQKCTNLHLVHLQQWIGGSYRPPSMLQTSIQVSLDLPERDTARLYHRQEIPGSAPGVLIKRGVGCMPGTYGANNYITNNIGALNCTITIISTKCRLLYLNKAKAFATATRRIKISFK